VPTFVLGEDQFWKMSPAAAEIFEYRRGQPDLAHAWGFDRGGVSDDRRMTWADFSCVALTGYGRDELVISAVGQADDSWKLSHTIKRAI